MGFIVNRLVESVHHNVANVRGDTTKFGERDGPFQRFTRNMIEEKPAVGRGAPGLLRMVLVHALMVLYLHAEGF